MIYNKLNVLNNNNTILLTAVLLFMPVFYLFKLTGDSVVMQLLIVIIPGIILVMLNYKVTYLLLIVTLFNDFRYYYFSSAIWFCFILVFSYLLNYKKIEIKEFKTPATFGLLIYILTIIPSYLNSTNIVMSLYLSFNLIALIVIMHLSYASIHSMKFVKNNLRIFFSLVIINSIYQVIIALISGRRSFGFTGIMFVDYLGIAIVMMAILILFSDNKKRIIQIPLFIFMVLSSLLTQTRNVWIVIILTLTLLILFLMANHSKYLLNRKVLLFILTFGILTFFFIFIGLNYINPSLTDRTTDITKQGEIIDSYGHTSNSLVTRFFIWHTAANAFLSHPIIGIGAFSFPFSSEIYSTLPELIYKKYVKGLSSHIGYLTALTETGIIGFFGFLFFIYTYLKKIFSISIINSRVTDVKIILMLNWALVYITISLFVTDAWFWGQGSVLWGILLGMNMALTKLTSLKEIQ